MDDVDRQLKQLYADLEPLGDAKAGPVAEVYNDLFTRVMGDREDTHGITKVNTATPATTVRLLVGQLIRVR